MSVNTKCKRKIEVNGRKFLWYVAPDEEYSFDTILHVYSEDKKFHITYALGKPENKCVLRLLEPAFNGKPADVASRWRLVLCPKFGHNAIVVPSDVRLLIEWCLSDKSEVILMDWEGNILTV